jgi:hypothetical protein
MVVGRIRKSNKGTEYDQCIYEIVGFIITFTYRILSLILSILIH